MTRDQGARVLGAGRPLEHRLGEVAGLGREGHSGPTMQRRPPAGRARRGQPLTTVAATIPPIRPAYVFDGEMWVRNLLRPNRLPMKYAPVSNDQTVRTRSTIQPRSAPSPASGAPAAGPAPRGQGAG